MTSKQPVLEWTANLASVSTIHTFSFHVFIFDFHSFFLFRFHAPKAQVPMKKYELHDLTLGIPRNPYLPMGDAATANAGEAHKPLEWDAESALGRDFQDPSTAEITYPQETVPINPDGPPTVHAPFQLDVDYSISDTKGSWDSNTKNTDDLTGISNTVLTTMLQNDVIGIETSDIKLDIRNESES
jgi:hypothetical protein